MRTIRSIGAATGVLAVTLAIGAGCKPRPVLSKDDALKLLQEGGVSRSKVERCVVMLPRAEKSLYLLTLDDQGDRASCLAAVGLAGFLELTCEAGEPGHHANRCKAKPRSDVTLTCAKWNRAMVGTDCTAAFDCVSAEISIDSVTTEERKATIHYTLAQSVDPAIKALRRECSTTTPDSTTELLTALVAKTDDGRWVLDSPPKDGSVRLPLKSPAPLPFASVEPAGQLTRTVGTSVNVTSVPTGATIRDVDGKVVCAATPCDVPMPGDTRKLRVMLDGYQTETILLDNVDGVRNVTLSK